MKCGVTWVSYSQPHTCLMLYTTEQDPKGLILFIGVMVNTLIASAEVLFACLYQNALSWELANMHICTDEERHRSMPMLNMAVYFLVYTDLTACTLAKFSSSIIPVKSVKIN